MNWNRRNFLKVLGQCSSLPLLKHPMEVLIGSLVSGLISKAEAESQGFQPRRHLNIYFLGGNPKWFFDLPLTPFEGMEMLQNTQLITSFQNGRGSYRDTSIEVPGFGSIKMPWIWSGKIPRPRGERVPMGRLLAEGMFILRGFTMPQDGHDACQFLVSRPDPSRPSVEGTVADYASQAMPAVSLADANSASYKSSKGIGLFQTHRNDPGSGEDTPLRSLLDPFVAKDHLSAEFMSRRDLLDALTATALGRLGNYTSANLPGTEGLLKNQRAATKLIQSTLTNFSLSGSNSLTDRWYTSLAKYKDLVSASTDITDVLADPIPYHPIYSKQERLIPGNSDIRTLINQYTHCGAMAVNFALAEYLLTENLTGSILMGGGDVVNLQYESWTRLDGDGKVVATGGETRGGFSPDEHLTGAYYSLVANTFRFKAFSACLYELIQVLKAKGIYDETVIQISSEFNRSPLKTGGGSDHAWNGSVFSCFSGCISQPIIVGNIKLSRPEVASEKYPGTWGESAPIDHEGAKTILNIGHATSSVCELLRIPPPQPNFRSVLSGADGKIKSIVGAPLNV